MQQHYPAHIVPIRLTVITLVAVLLAGVVSSVGLSIHSAAAARLSGVGRRWMCWKGLNGPWF